MSATEERVSLSAAANGQPAVVASPPLSSDIFSAPADAVPLPSLGLVYPSDHPFHGKELVEISPAGAPQEDILTSRGLLKTGRAISMLLKSCIVDKRVDADGLLVGDRNAIMVAIRITMYGAEYPSTVDCPGCEQPDKDASFDLSKFSIKRLGADPIEPGRNAFLFVLPRSGKEVVFRLPTGADDQELSTYLARMRKLSSGADVVEKGVTTRLIFSIVSIGGETDRERIGRIVNDPRQFPAMDSKALRRYQDKISPGVDMRGKHTCNNPDCPLAGEEQEVEVPIGPEFFWPSA